LTLALELHGAGSYATTQASARAVLHSLYQDTEIPVTCGAIPFA